MSTARYLLLTLSAFSLFFISCGLPGQVAVRTRALAGGKLDVTVTADKLANQNNPVAVSLLLVYDNQLLQELQSMPASQWFEKQSQIRENYPGKTGFESWYWEWVPDQKVPAQELPLRANAKAGIVFANYLTPGEHRAVFKPTQSVQINLQKEGFKVQP